VPYHNASSPDDMRHRLSPTPACEIPRPSFFVLRLVSRPYAPVCALLLALQGCGGGGGDSGSTAPTAAQPALGVAVTYAVTDTDNANNVIQWTLQS
jgi:hypothetical protein